MSLKLKVVVVGDANTGKSSLLSRYLFNKFNEDYHFTVGIDFHSKYIETSNGEQIRLQLWDTAGQVYTGCHSLAENKKIRNLKVSYNHMKK
uniref:Uncharacterized protein n=1 Tax=Acrobeloides nanus TaxID=290746 RepID=A0A914DQZ6_9BILA